MKPIRSSACPRRSSASRRAATAAVRSRARSTEYLGRAEQRPAQRRPRSASRRTRRAGLAVIHRRRSSVSTAAGRSDGARRLEALDEPGEVGVDAASAAGTSPRRARSSSAAESSPAWNGGSPGEQFLEQEPEGVEVAGGRGRLAARLFGAHVGQRPKQRASLGLGRADDGLGRPRVRSGQASLVVLEARLGRRPGGHRGCRFRRPGAAARRACPSSCCYRGRRRPAASGRGRSPAPSRRPAGVTITLPGLRSRWTMPAAWVTTSTCAIWVAMERRWAAVRPPSSAARRFRPSISSSTSQSCPPLST